MVVLNVDREEARGKILPSNRMFEPPLGILNSFELQN